MTAHPETQIMRMTDGIRFSSGPITWSLKPMRLRPGNWLAIVPEEHDPAIDPSGPLARVLATLSAPKMGTLELWSQDIYRVPYNKLQRMRAGIGYVQGYGGLLSNRTVRENITLPASVHGGFDLEEEKRVADEILAELKLVKIADLKPFEVDGYTRWRACLGRAMILRPSFLVLEGIGDWEIDRGRGAAWTCLTEYHKKNNAATVICLSRQNPEFEAWFEEHGGEVVYYERVGMSQPPKKDFVG